MPLGEPLCGQLRRGIYNPQQVIPLVFIGFETANIDDWAKYLPTGTSASIVTAPVYTGVYACKIYNNASGSAIPEIYKSVLSEHLYKPKLVFRCAIQISKLPPSVNNAGLALFEIQCSNPYFNTMIQAIYLTGSGVVFRVYARPSIYDLDVSVEVQANTWYVVDIELDKTTYQEKVYINRTLVKTINIGAAQQFTSFANYRLKARNYYWNSPDVSAYFDAFSYNDSLP